MWLEIIAGAFIGSILSTVITAYFERLRRPSLSLKIVKVPSVEYTDTNPPKPARRAQFLYVALVNNDLKKIGKWFSTRETASRCQGLITFHRLDGTNLFGRDMVLRWKNTNEPIGVDVDKYEHITRVDVSPGEEEPFNIAVRFDDEEDCYGWSNRSYFMPFWRPPDWKLPNGRYLVRVRVISSGNQCEGLFRLINDVPMKDFRLESALPGDKII